MTASTTTHPSAKKQNTRPTVWRLAAAKYVDLLLCGFMAWIACFAFGMQSGWPSVTIFLWVGETLWCRDRLNPTAGEYCLGIRYLTSSSSQVVADIQVVHNKLKMNSFLVAAGVGEITLAVLFLSGWTFLGKATVLGLSFGPPFSMFYWIFAGLAFFFCGGVLLGGSRNSLWALPLTHLAFTVDLYLGASAWKDILAKDLISPTGPARLLQLGLPTWELFAIWSFLVVAATILSRKHLVN